MRKERPATSGIKERAYSCRVERDGHSCRRHLRGHSRRVPGVVGRFLRFRFCFDERGEELLVEPYRPIDTAWLVILPPNNPRR